MSIEKRSPGYTILKSYVDFCFHRFYNVSFYGKEKIDLTDRMIFAPNHQNALVDALAVLSSFKWQPVFMARADIFGNNTVARILRFLKMLPVYRIRDGYDQLANNKEVFRETFDVLDNKSSLAILPEGNHEGKWRLRTLKKGIARIAFNYRHESASNKKEISIMPVGLNYSDYHEPGSDLHIRFGKPIPLSDFDRIYQESQSKAYNALINRLGSELKELMLHIEPEEIYPCVETTATLYEALHKKTKNTASAIFCSQQQIINYIVEKHENEPGFTQELQKHTNELNNILESTNLRITDLKFLKHAQKKSTSWFRIMFLTISSPVYFYCYIQNIIPSLISKNIEKRFKDPHFKSSVAFVLSIFLFPAIHLLQSILFLLITNSLTWSALYLASLPFTYIIKTSWEKMKERFFKIRKIQSILHPLENNIEKIGKKVIFPEVNWR